MPDDAFPPRDESFPFDEIFAELRAAFQVDTVDWLGRVEIQLDGVRKKRNSATDVMSDLRREVHSLKGNGTSFGFPTVSVVAHRLENYVAGLPQLDDAAIHDILVYFDRMRDILEGGDDGDENAAEIVRTLPVRGADTPPAATGPALEVLLIPSTPIIGRAVEGEFRLQGCRVTTLHKPFEAFELAIRVRPDLVVASAVLKDVNGTDLAVAFRAMTATRNIAFALLTSFPRSHPELKAVPEDVVLIRHDRDLAAQIAGLRETVGRRIAA